MSMSQLTPSIQEPIIVVVTSYLQYIIYNTFTMQSSQLMMEVKIEIINKK